MPTIINHFFSGEETTTPAPNGPVRSTTHFFFGGEKITDKEISPIIIPLSVSLQPAATETKLVGDTVTIGPVGASGGKPPYSYQWYKNNSAAGNASAKTNTYVSGALSSSDNGATYYCKISDSSGESVTTVDCVVTVNDSN